MLLSGGLDSSIIYGLFKQQGLNITPIHVNNHEYSYASLVAGDDKMVEVNLDSVGDYEAVEIHQSPVDLGSVKPQIAMARELDKLMDVFAEGAVCGYGPYGDWVGKEVIYNNYKETFNAREGRM